MNQIVNNIDNQLKQHDFSGSICLIKDREIIFEHSYGFANYDKGTPNTLDTCYSIASVTKQFTAVAILQLTETKGLQLDQTIESYFPNYAQSSKITIRNLLNMSSGIPDYLNDIIDSKYREEEKYSKLNAEEFFFYATDGMNQDFTFENVMRLVIDFPLLFTPGSRLSYSNTNYVLLGRIVEIISGMNLHTYIDTYILKQLHMNTTHWEGLATDAESYVIYNGCCRQLGKSRCKGADGGLVSTVHDLYRWILETSNHTILSEKNWNECFHFICNSVRDSWPDNYGFGWTKSGDWILHGGFQLGYSAGVAINKKAGYSVVILSNFYNNDHFTDPLSMITSWITDEMNSN